MPLIGVLLMLGLPLATLAVVWLRLRAKERARDEFLARLGEVVRNAGAEPLGDFVYRLNGRFVKIEAGTNPLFSSDFTVRLAAYSNTVHEFELRRGRPVPGEFAPFRPLLDRWDSAGKMHVECYAAGVRRDTAVYKDLRTLTELAGWPLSRPCRGATFTIREGFEKGCPQRDWRHDLRARLPKGVRRWCVSYWQGDPYLNGGLVALFDALAGTGRKFYISDAPDLRFLEYAFGRRGLDIHGTLVELTHADRAIAADRYLDGEFFGGLLVADAVPPEFGEVKRFRFHETALRVLPAVRFYARRLFDWEGAWYGGEYEILSVHPLEVREVLREVAATFGAQVLEIDRRFHKRLVIPRGD